MSKAIFVVLFVSLLGSLQAQTNIIPNGSFETYTACPSAVSFTTDQVPNCVGWYNTSPSADYLNVCATNTVVSVPINAFGHQVAACGNGYLGIFSFIPSNAREAAGAQLLTPLIVGQKYYAKITVSLADIYSTVAINKLGIRFTNAQHDFTNNASINNFAHVYTNSIISDSVGWTKIFGSFVADSNYQYLEIGNFFDNVNTATISVKPGGALSYYYVDDVCLSTDSLFTLNWTCPNISSVVSHANFNSALSLFPNPCVDGTVYLSKTILDATIDIYNGYGNKIKNEYKNSLREIDVSDLNDGIYYLKIQGQNLYSSTKFVIKK